MNSYQDLVVPDFSIAGGARWQRNIYWDAGTSSLEAMSNCPIVHELIGPEKATRIWDAP